MSQWQVNATGPDGAVMVFGLEAGDGAEAILAAIQRLPWSGGGPVEVTELLPPHRRPSVRVPVR